MLMFRKSNKDNGEKIFRYSIRKYHFGAASVAVAALMFFANGVQAQAPEVSLATASEMVAGSAGNSDGDPQESDGEESEKVSQTEPSAELKSTGESNSTETKAEDASKGQETAALAPTKPETKPAAQETSQGGAVKEQDQLTSATKTTEAKSLQGTLETLLANLTLDSMKALHDEVESRLAAAKAVLDDPKATQEQVDEQVKLMEDLTRRVREVLSPQVSTPPVLEKAGLTNHGLAAPEGAILTPKTAVTKALEESHVSSTNGEVSTPSTELSKPEVSDSQNKDKLKTLSKDLSAYLIQANEITRPETKKLLEGVEEVVKSIEASVLQPQLTPAEIEELLKKGKQAERKLALALTREKSGKRDLRNSKPMKQGSDFRATPMALTTKRAYIVRKGDGSDLPAETYLYALRRGANERPREENLREVREALEEAKVTVTNLGSGNFRWDLTFNSKQNTHQNAFYWFTLPTGHTITDTLAVTRRDGTHTKSSVVGRDSFNAEWGKSIKNTLGGDFATYGPASGRNGNFNRNFGSIKDVTNTDFIAKGASNQRTGASPTDTRGSEGYYYLGPTSGRFYKWQSGTGVSNDFYNKSERIIDGLKQHTDLLYHFTLNTGEVRISYITHTDTPYAPIYYGTGMRTLEYNEAKMYFTVRGLQEKPNAPTVNANKGTVTVTPYSNQNQNVDKVELSYKNKNNESKIVTLSRDPRTRTWTSSADGIEIKGNSFSLKAGVAKAGTEVSAKSYFGNSDASDTNKVTVPTPQNMQYNPQAKNPKQSVSRGVTPSAGASVDTNGLPGDTTYEWKTGHKPDTNTSKTNPPGDKDGVVVVTYPDGTTDEVAVKVTVTAQNTQHNPQAKDPKQAVSKGATPSAGASVDTNGLPDGTTYEWKEGHKPDTNTSKTNPPGDKDGVVVVTYPDGTTDEVNVTVKVTGQDFTPAKPGQGMVPRPNPTPTPRPDDSANTDNGGTTSPAGSNSNSVTPDNSGNTPTHSEDSTNQAASQSTQQRETGNSTESESPQGISESSVTAPARSRRSVAFAGGTQSSQEKQVDKSVLRDLIQDLETRLKDLDGIDQSVIDAAKIILGEGQEALRNTDLTEAGLREITAKVKEALESLKGKQATKDKEEMQETSKDQGHLPYGTMIGSLLALLGLLLFLIARRKKESELKKLTKELTKVLQESDLTSVDVKVLDQAREALAQAVAFLANEKESDHTEDELIEKLKAILAQLK